MSSHVIILWIYFSEYAHTQLKPAAHHDKQLFIFVQSRKLKSNLFKNSWYASWTILGQPVWTRPILKKNASSGKYCSLFIVAIKRNLYNFNQIRNIIALLSQICVLLTLKLFLKLVELLKQSTMKALHWNHPKIIQDIFFQNHFKNVCFDFVEHLPDPWNNVATT